MNQKTILDLLNAPRFQPFRIYMSDHRTYDIYHRDFVWAHPTHLLIITPGPGERTLARTEFASLRHVVRVEMLEEQAVGEEG